MLNIQRSISLDWMTLFNNLKSCFSILSSSFQWQKKYIFWVSFPYISGYFNLMKWSGSSANLEVPFQAGRKNDVTFFSFKSKKNFIGYQGNRRILRDHLIIWLKFKKCCKPMGKKLFKVSKITLEQRSSKNNVLLTLSRFFPVGIMRYSEIRKFDLSVLGNFKRWLGTL